MKNRLVGAVAGLGLAAAMVPAVARAANPPVTQCSPAAFQVCAAVSSSTTWNGTSGTVTLVAWNLFGNAGFTGSLSSVLTYVGIGNSSYTGTATLVSAMYNGGSVLSTSPSIKGWNQGGTSQGGNIGATIDMSGSTSSGINRGLIGCTQTVANGELQTCYSNTAEALTLVFDVNKQFSLDGAIWEVHAQAVNGTSCSLWLGSNGKTTDDAGTGCTSTVTPEPVTMALLGTGLAGMGLARLRRRKKDGDIESV